MSSKEVCCCASHGGPLITARRDDGVGQACPQRNESLRLRVAAAAA